MKGRTVCVWVSRHRAKVFDIDGRLEEVAVIDAVDGGSDHVRMGELRLSRRYLSEVTDALPGAGELMILGPDRARILLAGWLNEERPQLARRIVASAPCEEGANGEIIARARGLLDTVRITDA